MIGFSVIYSLLITLQAMVLLRLIEDILEVDEFKPRKLLNYLTDSIAVHYKLK
jgi:hypothetical protein